MSLGLRLFLLFLAVFGCFAAYHLRRTQVERWLGLEPPPPAARPVKASLDRVPGVETEFTIRIRGRAPTVRQEAPAGRFFPGALAADSRMSSANPGETFEGGDGASEGLIYERERAGWDELPFEDEAPEENELPPYEEDPAPPAPEDESGGASAGEEVPGDDAPGEDPAVVPAGRYRTHVVQKNEKLWKIAEKYLGKGHRYREIVELNAAILGGSEVLQPGMELRIPPE